MVSFSARKAVFIAVICAAPVCGLHAQRAGAGTAARTDTSMSGARADARDRAALDSLRREVLSYANFAGFASTPCGGADLRTFERDSTGARVPALLARMELLVLSHGVSATLNTESGRALMRALVRLEAGGPGPRWDVLTGAAPRAFNPILPTKLYNPQEKKCEATPGEEPDGIILPAPPLSGFVAPSDSGTASVHIRYGPSGENEIRDLFFARFASDTSAVLRLTRVNAYAIWENYAIVSVVRTRQQRGVTPLASQSTGAVYAFHRVGHEWRLLALVRSH